MHELPGLRLAVVENGEYARAPEFRYLASWVRQEAESVFGTVREVPATEPLAPAEDTPVLVLDSRTLVARRSLERMAGALAPSARPGAQGGVAPVTLAETELAARAVRGDGLYTLRGFELLEEAFLARSVPEVSADPAAGLPRPCLLLAAAAAARLAGTPPASWLEAGPAAAPARAGLCHRFADYYGQAREDVIEHLTGPDAPRCRDVLEIGCGRGATGRALAERLGCRVTGVELNPVVALAAAAVLHRVVAGDFLAVAREVEALGPFDALVATELFEHLTEQEAFLDLAARLVRPGGRIVLSVPNVGHWAVVEDLLAGRWDYLPIGLLCYTHYRFFTRKTLEDWLRRSGFRSFRLVPQETELPERFRGSPGGFVTDPESLSAKGFWVVIDRE